MQQKNHRSILNVLALRILNSYSIKIFALILPVLFFVNSCTKDITPPPVKKIETVTKYIEKTPLNLDKPAPVEMSKVNWILITEDNYADVFAELKDKNADGVLFGLTDDNYETLSKNFAQIRAYIIKQNEIIKQYKNYYENVTN